MISDNISAELVKEIGDLKKKRDAVILAHNYQLGEVQDTADYTGDSLELAQIAAKTDAAVIVFCGVDFMAETAAILCPEKTVLLPERRATCPMANMVSAAALRQKKQEMPGAAVVCYVNSTAEVKAASDICCTSANGVAVVKSLDEKEVLFVPDENLGHYVSTQVAKKITLWPGYCPIHVRIRPEDIRRAREAHPEAVVMVHPECLPEVIALADHALSTGGMLRFAGESQARQIIVGTEIGMLYRLEKENPEKTFIPATLQAVCPDMKLINPEKVRDALRDMSPVIKVPEKVRVPAAAAVARMLKLSA